MSYELLCKMLIVGVAELDTFEITSIQNQRRLATKRLPTDKHITDHSQVSSSNEVNAL